MKIKIILLVSILFSIYSYSQKQPTSKLFSIKKKASVNLQNDKEDWRFSIRKNDSLYQYNNYDKTLLMQRKQEIEKRFPRKNITHNFKSITTDTSLKIIINKGFEGNIYDFTGVPNDNSIAVSNNGTVISAVNSTLYIFNSNDSTLYSKTLGFFSDTLDINSHIYDPKLLYDPEADRFVLVFLSGSTDSVSNIVVAFTQTADPIGEWNLYTITGNPLNDTSWFDYPALALTKDELFLTGNLLRNGGSWQTSFKQSIVWQIDKKDGYEGRELNVRLWKDIAFSDKNLRNIQPIMGGDSLKGPDIYLLSNRNFGIQSDSIFLIHISGKLDNVSTALTTNLAFSDKAYGMPPDAKQNAYRKLATNDARILGGFIKNEKIQFVSNTIDTTTGLSAVYHGIISNLKATNPSVHGNIISDSILYFGYPNISYTGKLNSDEQCIITFNHVAPGIFPGFSSVFFNKTDSYSTVDTLKTGNSIVNVISGLVERWGDYSGSQRKYNEPGVVYASGSFGLKKSLYKVNGTWIVSLTTPISDRPQPIAVKEFSSRIGPNPGIDEIVQVKFLMPNDDKINISIYDINGKKIKTLFDGMGYKDKENIVSFSSTYLQSGVYFIVIKQSNKVIKTEKFIAG